MRFATLWILGLSLAGLSASTSAQPANEAPFMLLQNQFGELCTMCEASLECRPTSSDSPVTTYRFQKKTFLGQMRTVLDFVPGLGPGAWESRPVITSNRTIQSVAGEARLSLKEAKIEVPGATIDRRTGAWIGGDGGSLGQCRTPNQKAAQP